MVLLCRLRVMGMLELDSIEMRVDVMESGTIVMMVLNLDMICISLAIVIRMMIRTASWDIRMYGRSPEVNNTALFGQRLFRVSDYEIE